VRWGEYKSTRVGKMKDKVIINKLFINLVGASQTQFMTACFAAGNQKSPDY
jgi:hypothetical protein